MLAAVVGAALSGGAPAPAAAQESGDRPYLLERVDDAAIVQITNKAASILRRKRSRVD